MKRIKITRSSYRGDYEVPLDVAIRDALTPDAYSYEGQLERLEATVSKQNDVIQKLFLNIFDPNSFTKPLAERVKDIIGFGFTVEEVDDESEAV